MMKKNVLLITTLLMASCFLSCKKDDPINGKDDGSGKGEKGIVRIEVAHFAGDQPLLMDGMTRYRNSHGDDFTVTMLKYYVSNLVLIKADGSTFAEPESYHLVNQAEENSLQFILTDVPAGKYDKLKLMIGVDSLRNVSGAQTGALDPLNDMFWTWSTGYIMAKMEGKSNASTAPGSILNFHIGGFSGPYSVLQEVVLELPQDLMVSVDKEARLHLKSDLLSWFDAPFTIDFATMNNVAMQGPEAQQIAQNYRQMFSVISVE